MIQEFLAFLQWYNVVWVAVWLIIASKVTDLVNSLVEDVVTPLILNPVFKRLHIDKLEDMSYNGVLYWKALAKLLSFIVVALLIFILVKNFDLPQK